MGCFNISGFFSHLPIKCGDRIGAILCAQQCCNENIAMETNSLGIYPLISPIYGEYDDCGGMVNMDASLSANAFKKLTGIDFITFIEKNGRNGGVSMNTIDNENQFDDIPGYQSIIKKLIPEYYRSYSGEKLEKNIADAEASGDEAVLKQYIQIRDYENKQKANLLNASFLIIYDHESVIKQLIHIGDAYMNNEWYDRTYNISKDYDAVAKYADTYGGSIFNINKIREQINNNFFDGIHEQLNNDNTLSNEEKDICSYIIDKHNKHYYDIEAAEIAERRLLTDNIRFCDFFGAVYKNQKINHAELKNDILDLLYLNTGLYCMHGMYAPSSYAGQSIYYNELIGMNNIFVKIIDDLHDVADDINSNY